MDLTSDKVVQDRVWPINSSKDFDFRLVVVNGMVDIYVNHVLVMDYYLAEVGEGRVSLVSREGEAWFVDASYRAVKATNSP